MLMLRKHFYKLKMQNEMYTYDLFLKMVCVDISCHLLVAAYVLVNSNAMWQKKSDQPLIDFVLQQCQQVPQLYFKQGGKLLLFVAKVVDDIKVTGCGEHPDMFIKNVQ